MNEDRIDGATPDSRTQKRRIWGWYFFDWANQPYNTLLLTFIFAPYFAASVAPDPVSGQAMWGAMMAVTGVIVALLAPVLGAIADSAGPKRPWLFLWSALYVVGASALWWAMPGGAGALLALVAFGVGVIGLEFGIIFTNAYLPTLGGRADLGRISGNGWAFGYAGGLVSLIIMLLFLAENEGGTTLIGLTPPFGLDPDLREGTRAVGPFTAFWYLVFVIPFFLWVREPAVARVPRVAGAVQRGVRDVWATLRGLPRHPSLLAYLGSSMLYRDALNGIYAFGGIYAAGVLGWSITQIGVFGIMAALTGAIFCLVGGRADARFGPKPVIAVCILLLTAVCGVIITTDRAAVLLVPVAAGSNLPDIAFYICGGLIGAAGGAVQAASRNMMVRQANPARMTEAFGLYALSGKATAFLAPALVALVTQVTQSQQLGVIPIAGLFVAGLILLYWVHPEGEVATA
ncbi:MFS transporter [Roseicitreum antarcticum]|uniref:MFS transporter, UMF1 family n=1 Tax=Roseicitreum antarcticum TaxID=564137 RepID=A0A1H3AVU4_9RHOB|nr:MFS transporter [Roseicitreum antarcticum]SDX33501.1 MFS transporter, UMF1 family [Roseicitreum antarcticum]